MKMLLHELHPAVVHGPLTLLPTATAADWIAVVSGDRAWAKVGRRLWVAGTVSTLFSGLAGLAASQEVRLNEPRARDMVFIHGIGNACISLGAVGVTLWRLRHPPSLGQSLIALMANMAGLYTASLGGKVVYEMGVGTHPMQAGAPAGTMKGPPLLSRAAPRALLRDGLQGVRWLISRAKSLLTGAQPLVSGSKGFGPSYEVPTVPELAMAHDATGALTELPRH